MGMPLAKQGDRITALDTHDVVVGNVTRPEVLPFSGHLTGNLSNDVLIEGRPAATVGSTATNLPGHTPTSGVIYPPASNQGTVSSGSTTVVINGRAAARAGDRAHTCNHPVDLPVGTLLAAGTVYAG
jgi:uncharacterized Zn-binding protein involved in type VI secretion